MSHDRPTNTWWRFVPRTRAVGVFSVACCVIAFVAAVWALVAHIYPTTTGTVLEALVAVLLAVSAFRSVTGLAALRQQPRR